MRRTGIAIAQRKSGSCQLRNAIAHRAAPCPRSGARKRSHWHVGNRHWRLNARARRASCWWTRIRPEFRPGTANRKGPPDGSDPPAPRARTRGPAPRSPEVRANPSPARVRPIPRACTQVRDAGLRRNGTCRRQADAEGRRGTGALTRGGCESVRERPLDASTGSRANRVQAVSIRGTNSSITHCAGHPHDDPRMQDRRRTSYCMPGALPQRHQRYGWARLKGDR